MKFEFSLLSLANMRHLVIGGVFAVLCIVIQMCHSMLFLKLSASGLAGQFSVQIVGRERDDVELKNMNSFIYNNI